MKPRLLLFLFFLLPLVLSAQQWRFGAEVATGHSWEIERLPFRAAATEFTGVAGGVGVSLAAVLEYELGAFALSARPGILYQGTEVFRRFADDDGGMSVRRPVYEYGLLLPAYLRWSFGRQRTRPFLRLGGGLLVDLGGGTTDPLPAAAPVLPFAEVAVGLSVRTRRLALRPTLSVRNGTGELFLGNRVGFAGQRWGYAAVGVVVIGAGGASAAR